MRGGPVLDMMDFTPIAAHVATRTGAATVHGTTVEVMHCCFRAGPSVPLGHAEGMPHPQ
jgi:hypothetical protein